MELKHFIPVSAPSPASDSMQYYGLLGDYVGGFWGTIVAAVTALIVLLTWRASRRAEYRAKTYQVFAEMMRTHEEIVSSLNLGGQTGREVFASILREFYVIYKLTRNVVADNSIWSVKNRVDIAWTCTFYGPHMLSENLLKHYGDTNIRMLFGKIHTERQAEKNGGRGFGGHQLRLSHYFRNLFLAYEFLDASKLGSEEKSFLAKVLRSKLSNYEQAILAINIISNLGVDWELSGLVVKYKPIKNIPDRFFTFDKDFNIKESFRYINFDWENYGKFKIESYHKKIGNWHISVLRKAEKH